MVFSYTVTADKHQGLTGWLNWVRGTWTAGNAATGTIVTGLSDVILHGLVNTEVVSEAPTYEANKDGAGAAAPGSIGITAFADQLNNIGTWWAIGYV